MGRTKVLREKGRVEGMETGEKVGNRKTGCREATEVERDEGGERRGWREGWRNI